MNVLLLNAMEKGNGIINCLTQIFRERNYETTVFQLQDANILPCRGCNACSFKSPGKCVFNDDIHSILRAWVASQWIVMASPVRFGGYSPYLKKALDKCPVLALPFYGATNGRLHHLPRYDRKSLLVIGEMSNHLPGEAENFQKLAAGNAWNMQYDHQTLIFRQSDAMENVKRDIENSLMKGTER